MDKKINKLPKRYKIACVLGTRPEVIKMAPVVFELHKYPEIETVLISTGQHRELFQSMMDIFGLKADINLNLMKKNQTLYALAGRACLQLAKILQNNHYNLIIAQGDTTTTFIAGLVAFYLKIPFAHIESGLRSFDMYHPYPEEMNRVFLSKISKLHFAPTHEEKNNLIKENIPRKSIYVTGNTGIDALKFILKKKKPLPFKLPKNKRIILVTIHHRENFGKPLIAIFHAIQQLATEVKDSYFILPVHLNPNIKKLAYKMLSGHHSIRLIPPLSYDDFSMLMKKSYLIMTDSGGIEEEAPVLGKPLIILRTKTERVKIVRMKLGILVGHDTKKIVFCTKQLLNNPKHYRKMVKNISPYGDGQSAKRIGKIVRDWCSSQLSHELTVSSPANFAVKHKKQGRIQPQDK